MSCMLALDNPGVYHLGDSVHGRVVCNFTSRENFRSIKCKFRGREYTSWTETESYYDSTSKQTKTRSVQYTGDNKFLLVDLNLVGEGHLQAGHYEYPFSFTFPRSGIPNPYNGNYGYIRYYIKATVDKSFAFDYEDEITLHLISPIDFNYIRNNLQLSPVSYQDEKVLCCCCCASDPITMNLYLEKEAFVIGEVAKIKVDVTNMSNESIETLRIVLKMTIESKTTSPSTHYRYDKELVAFTTATGVGAHGQRTYNIDFQIPPSTVVPNFQGCSLFNQWCVLKAEAVLPGCHKNMEIETGVTLGHIPITGYDPQVASGSTMVPASQSQGGPFAPPVFNSDISPPPYPPEGEKAPPYPSGPPSFPVSNGIGDIGFSSPYLPSHSGKGMPVPVHGGASSSSASAPREEGAPSAPSKAELAESENFEVVDGDSEEPPPPAYADSMRDDGSSSKLNAPSAPPK